MTKRVLLTGGAGFIGHHCISHFLACTDWTIVVLDGLTYAGDVGRITDCEGFDPKRVEIHWHDLRAPIPSTLDRRLGHIDAVINMASASHVDRSISHPRPFVENNVAVVLSMLDWAVGRANEGRPVSHFIQVSTDEVYGPAVKGHSHKEWETIYPSNPYAASKAAQEAIAFSYWRTFGVPVIITNTMNNFGERQGAEKFIPKVIDCLLAGKPVPVHARQTGAFLDEWTAGSRVWLHARNHADALRFLIESTEPLVHLSGHADRCSRWNVAGEEEIANDEMVRRIAKILDVEPLIEYTDFHSSRPGHDLRYSLDGSKLRTQGWEPPVPLEESLERTVRWTVDNRHWLAEVA